MSPLSSFRLYGYAVQYATVETKFGHTDDDRQQIHLQIISSL